MISCNNDSVIFIGNTSRLVLSGLSNDLGEPQNHATVELIAFRKRNGHPVNMTLPRPMNYIPDSDGDYETELSANLPLKPDRWYEATVRAVSGSLVYQASELMRATVRRD